MAEVLKGWHSDPFGIHELRYFTMDGRPSRLVRDGGVQSSDPPPENMPFVASSDPSSLPPAPATGHPGSVAAQPPPDRPQIHHASADGALGMHGWGLTPGGDHQERDVARGEPTRLARDGGIESYHEPETKHAGESRQPLEMTLRPAEVQARAGSTSQTFTDAHQDFPRSANGTLTTSSNQGSIELLPSHSVSARNSWRKVVLVVVVAAGLAAGVISLILSTTNSNSPSLAACSLLTSAQAHGLLGQSGRIVEQSLRPRANGCDYSGFVPRPHSTATGMLVTLQQAPKDFPTSEILERGKVVKLDGQATYFVPGPMSPTVPVPKSTAQYFLLAVKDGHEVSIQVSASMPQQEAIAQRAMSLVLPEL
jgi:hypothetical protein